MSSSPNDARELSVALRPRLSLLNWVVARSSPVRAEAWLGIMKFRRKRPNLTHARRHRPADGVDAAGISEVNLYFGTFPGMVVCRTP